MKAQCWEELEEGREKRERQKAVGEAAAERRGE